MGMFDFLSGNNSKAGFEFSNQLKQNAQSYNPYTQGGKDSFNDLLSRYSGILNDPAAIQNEIASGYKPSDAYKVQEKYLTNALNNNAATTGQLGSGYSAFTMGQGVNDLLSQDMNTYIDRALGQFNNALGGEQWATGTGLNALNSQNNILNQAAEAEMQQKQQNSQSDAQMFGGLLNLGANFATGGAGGFGTLAGGIGKSVMPGSFTSQFQQDPNAQLIALLKQLGIG